jgi:hypothetical protein
MSTELLKVVKPESIISMQVSGGFYQRVRLALFNIMSSKTEEEIQSAIKKMSAKEELTEPWMIDYETLMIFCKEFERIAEETNQYSELTFEELEQQISEALKKEQVQ